MYIQDHPNIGETSELQIHQTMNEGRNNVQLRSPHSIQEGQFLFDHNINQASTRSFVYQSNFKNSRTLNNSNELKSNIKLPRIKEVKVSSNLNIGLHKKVNRRALANLSAKIPQKELQVSRFKTPLQGINTFTSEQAQSDYIQQIQYGNKGQMMESGED